MNPLVWTWILSLTGALLFFGAGTVFNARRLAIYGRLGLASVPEFSAAEFRLISDDDAAPPDPSAASRTRSAGPDLDAQLAEAQARCVALEREIERHNADRALLARELDTTRKRAEEHRRVASSELDSMRARINELAQSAGDDAATAALHHELAMGHERESAQATQLEALRQENARLRQVEDELTRAKRELDKLALLTRDLRAQVYASKPPPKKRSSPPPKVSTLSSALQSIVDSETRSSSVKSAVIADELGLLVAASGASHEYGDALAALGAYLADVGTKTRDLLPLNEVRQVVVRDDRDMTLTVRPLVSDAAGLALVTLSVDPKPIVTHS